MTKEMRTEAINRAFEAMLAVQELNDMGRLPDPKWLASNLYEINWAIYQLLLEGRKERREL